MNRKAKLEKALAPSLPNDTIRFADMAWGIQCHSQRLEPLHAAMLEAVEALEFALKYLNDTNDCGLFCDLSVDWHTPECCMETSFTKALAKIDDALDSLHLGPDCKPTRDESGT